ncbi:MAG: hypothetical protein U0M60_22560 [Clostridia bacterium]|nr:hypothetical protein [Clostridia bacterium]
MPYRCDFYSDEEYQQALVLAEQQKEQIAFEEYAYEQYLREERIMFDKKTPTKRL